MHGTWTSWFQHACFDIHCMKSTVYESLCFTFVSERREAQLSALTSSTAPGFSTGGQQIHSLHDWLAFTPSSLSHSTQHDCMWDLTRCDWSTSAPLLQQRSPDSGLCWYKDCIFSSSAADLQHSIPVMRTGWGNSGRRYELGHIQYKTRKLCDNLHANVH